VTRAWLRRCRRQCRLWIVTGIVHVELSTLVHAPRDVVATVYADYEQWPRLFPTIRAVRPIRQEGPALVLEIDRAEGTVINTLIARVPESLDLWEIQRHYHARLLNRFETVPGGTRLSVRGDIKLKGYAKVLRPFLYVYVRWLIGRCRLEPVKTAAERRARHAR
jgi:hypothetical protein